MSKAKDSFYKAWNSTSWADKSVAGIQGASGILGAFGETSRIKDTSNYQNEIDSLANTQFGYGDYDSLMGAYTPSTIDKLSVDDLRASDGERALGTLKGIGSGAIAGAQIGGVPGAIVGGVAGLLSGGLGMITGNQKAASEARRLNQEAEEAQQRYIANFANNAQNISQNKFNAAALNLAAFGGFLKDRNMDNFTKSKVRLAAFGGDLTTTIEEPNGFSNGVIKVDEGKTHETNPFGGVLMGVDPQGTPNLVEQGEVIFNDYVFSNRLYPTGGQLESVRLPKRYEGKSYADIAFDIQRESEIRPLDSISRNSLIDSMSKLTTIQEESRQRDLEYQAFDELENAFADGGSIHIKPSKRGTFTAAAKKHGMGVQEFASKVLANKDKYSTAMVRKANFAHNAAGWKHAFGGNLYANGSIISELKSRGFTTDAAKKQMETNIKRAFGRDGFQGFDSGEFGGAGASGSFAYDPEGITMFDYVRNTPIPVETSFSDAYAQARKDGLKTFMFNGKEYTTDYDPNAKLGPMEYEITVANLRQVLDENRKEIPDSTRIEPWVGQIPGEYKRTRAFGGPVGNMFSGPGNEDNFMYFFGEPEYGSSDNVTFDANGLPVNQNNNNEVIRPYQQKPWITAMRAIPVMGSSLQALGDAFGWSNKEDYENPTLIRKAADRIRNVKTSPIGRYMSYNPYDVDYEMNRLQNVGLGTQRGLLDTAGGNALAARNAMLALNNNVASQMGDARRSASQINEQRRQAVQQFNSGIDQFNAQQALNAGIYNQRADEAKMDAAIREAMLRDNIQSTLSQARSLNYTSALNNAGQFGNDRMFADMAAWYQKYVAPFNKATQAYGAGVAAKGGKIKGFKVK